MAGPLKTYAFINAKLRARISKLLSEENFKALAKCSSLQEALGQLKGTDYDVLESLYVSTGDLKMGELELFSRELSVLKGVERHIETPVLDVVQALEGKYEIENLKQALRLWFDRVIRKRSINERVGYLYRGFIEHSIDVDRLINQDTLEGLAGELSETPYGAIIAANSEEIQSSLTLFPAEIALDRFYYTLLMEAVEKLSDRDRSIAKRLIIAEIDLENLNWLIRMKDFYDIPPADIASHLLPWGGMRLAGGEIDQLSGSRGSGDLVSEYIARQYSQLKPLLSVQTTGVYNRLALMEKIFHEIMMLEIQHMLYGYPFTIGIILAYFFLKKMEIQKITGILNGQFYEFPAERMAGLL